MFYAAELVDKVCNKLLTKKMQLGRAGSVDLWSGRMHWCIFLQLSDSWVSRHLVIQLSP